MLKKSQTKFNQILLFENKRRYKFDSNAIHTIHTSFHFDVSSNNKVELGKYLLTV